MRIGLGLAVLMLLAGPVLAGWVAVPLSNADFEAWDAGKPSGWELFPGIDPKGCQNTSTVTRVAGASGAGFALQLSGDTATCRWLGPMMGPLAVSPGEIYRLSGMMKTEGVDAEGRRFRNSQFFAIAFDAANKRCGYYGIDPVYGTTPWTRLEKGFVIPPNATTMKVGLFLSVPGSATFDDLRLERLERPVPEQGWNRTESWRTDADYLVDVLEAVHPAPYAVRSREGFRRDLDTLVAQADRVSDADMSWRLHSVICSLGDSHTSIGLPAGREGRLPIQLCFFGDDIRVSATTKEHEALLGTRLVACGDRRIDDALAIIRRQIAYTHENWFREQAPGWLRMPAVLRDLGLTAEPDAITYVGVDTDGREVTETVRLLTPGAKPEIIAAGPDSTALPLYRRAGGNYWFQYLEDPKTLYVKYDRCEEDPARPLKKFTGDLLTVLDTKPVERFVLDVRDNAGGANIIGGLIQEVAKRTAGGRIRQTFVIIGRRTYSAAVNDAVLMKQQAGAILVGEATGMAPNHPGEVIALQLPCSGLAFTCSSKMIRMVETDAPALLPDVEVAVSWADFLAGRDAALDAVLSYKQP
jgi:hypothetical protein